ncbi:MAG TPA: glycosyltransferase family 1 protein [Nitrospiria bacterium]|nr:glycosyltransferase family 1 protein [Nitrospiria bacterium]
MRVLMNGIPLLTPHSGVGNYVYQLSKALPLVSDDTLILYFYGMYFRNRVKLQTGQLYKSVQSIARKFGGPYQASQVVKETIFKLGCLSQKMDLYHETNYVPLPFQGPIINTVFDLSILLWPETHPENRRRYFEKYFYKRLPWAAHMITTSEATKSQMIEHLNIKPDKITVTYLGVDDSFAGVPAETARAVLSHYGLAYGSYILYVGTLEPRKNITAVLQAYAQLPKKIQSAYPLVLAGGKGWLMEDLDEEIKRHRIASSTILTGYVSKAHLPSLYSGATVFVYPSLYEGFGLPPLEAMACGAPVITSDVSSLPEVVGPAGVLVAPRDVKRLKDEMERVIEDSSHRALLSKLGLERSRQFTWEACARQTVDVYNRVLNTGG